jgi:glutathione synthase/RimK-type ligase-like ATP-grasp enzyme
MQTGQIPPGQGLGGYDQTREMTQISDTTAAPSGSPFIGLAPFLRMSIAGEDLQAAGQHWLARAQNDPEDRNAWLNLSIAAFCLGQREVGLSVQAAALAAGQVYHLPAARQPARLRLLMLVAPGDLAANTPLECLLEDSDIDLVFYYLLPGQMLPTSLPAHDALLVAMSESDDNRALLDSLEPALADWPVPVINAPQHIPNTGRNVASELLQEVPGLCVPLNWRLPRGFLENVAEGRMQLGDLLDDCTFPVILRPVDSHAGRDLDRLADPEALAEYLARVGDDEFFLANFIDYSDARGLFRKFRVALIDGRPFACHMAVSSHWMVHYVNADMYGDAAKRAEELRFMEEFAHFAERHAGALRAIHERTGLDYLCIDCAETAAGELLLFEIDHAMVVHAMDSETLFPYKQVHMLKVKNAFRDYLIRLTGAASGAVGR